MYIVGQMTIAVNFHKHDVKPYIKTFRVAVIGLEEILRH
jgi:hypothetical protein